MTRRLHIDFAPNARRGSWLPRALLGLALIALVASAVRIGQVLGANAKLAEQLSALETGSSQVRPVRGSPGASTDTVRTRLVRQVANELVTPWSALLQSLESAPSEAVALLSVEPSVSKHKVRLIAEARTLSDMLAYLNALQHDAHLSAVVLISHELQPQSPGKPVRFQIEATWGTEP